MSNIQYLDINGLAYYDARIKQFIEDNIPEAAEAFVNAIQESGEPEILKIAVCTQETYDALGDNWEENTLYIISDDSTLTELTNLINSVSIKVGSQPYLQDENHVINLPAYPTKQSLDIDDIEAIIPNDATSSNKLTTEQYVGVHGGKIDSISITGAAQTIDVNKNVDLPTIRTDTSAQNLGTQQKLNAKTNLDLNNVVNTGDSATPLENGTTKFTTGGAYTLKNDLDTEVERALVAEQILDDKIETNVEMVNTLNNKIDDETTRALVAEQILDDKVETNTEVLNSKIDDEISRAVVAETILDDKKVDKSQIGYIEISTETTLTDAQYAECLKDTCFLNQGGVYYYKSLETDSAIQFSLLPMYAKNENYLTVANIVIDVNKSTKALTTTTITDDVYFKSYIDDGMLHKYKGTSSINLYSGLEKVVIPCIVEGIYSPVPSDASYSSSTTYYIKASDFEIETDKEYISFEEAAGEPMNAEHFEDYKDFLYTYTSNVTYVHPTVYDPDETYYRYSSGKYVDFTSSITASNFDRLKNAIWIIVYTTITFPTKTGTVALTSDLSLNDYQDSNSVNFTLGSEKVTIPYVASTYTVPTGAYDSSITYYGLCSDWDYPSTESYAPYNDIVAYVDDPEECPPLDATVYSELVAEHLLYIKDSNNEIIFPTKSGTVALTSDITGGIVEKTYSELKAMRDGETLVAGTQYRITDYTCTTTTTNTSSAGHQFDIIVVADSSNKLNENARAVLHSDDTYFVNSKLEAWELKYSIDNDTTRFEWADTTNGKGVIYYMKDEFNNECSYDFKNIRFSVYINATNYTYTNIYTFSKQPSSTYEDASLYADPYYTTICHDNMIKAYYVESSSDFSMKLKANIMWVGCYNNTIENNCYSNMLQAGCYDNVIQNKSYQIYIENHSSSNNIGESSSYIKFGSDNHTNIIGSYANNLTLGNYNSYNRFNNHCAYIRLGNSIFYNNFGNDCSYIAFGSSTTTINYCRRITFDDGVKFIYLISSDTTASASNYLQDINIHKGILGSSDGNRLTITVPDRNLDYSIDYYATNSMEVYL